MFAAAPASGAAMAGLSASGHAAGDEEHDAARASVTKLALRFSLILVLIAAIAFTALFFIGHEISGAGGHGGDEMRQFVIGDEVLAVPANTMRFANTRRAAAGERLELRLRWPMLDGDNSVEETGMNEAEGGVVGELRIDPSLIFLVIEPRGMSLDMSGRIEPLYSKFLQGDVLDAGYGLKKRALSEKAGFLDEDLYYEADNPYPFAARCIRTVIGAATPYCLRDIHIGRGLMVTYRFHLSLISEWMHLDAAIRGRIKEMLLD